MKLFLKAAVSALLVISCGINLSSDKSESSDKSDAESTSANDSETTNEELQQNKSLASFLAKVQISDRQRSLCSADSDNAESKSSGDSESNANASDSNDDVDTNSNQGSIEEQEQEYFPINISSDGDAASEGMGLMCASNSYGIMLELCFGEESISVGEFNGDIDSSCLYLHCTMGFDAEETYGSDASSSGDSISTNDDEDKNSDSSLPSESAGGDGNIDTAVANLQGDEEMGKGSSKDGDDSLLEVDDGKRYWQCHQLSFGGDSSGSPNGDETPIGADIPDHKPIDENPNTDVESPADSVVSNLETPCAPVVVKDICFDVAAQITCDLRIGEQTISLVADGCEDENMLFDRMYATLCDESINEYDTIRDRFYADKIGLRHFRDYARETAICRYE